MKSFGASSYPRSKSVQRSQSVPRGPTECPSVPSLITTPHLSQSVGSYFGGFSNTSKLYSFVPYQTYISV